MTPLIRVRGTLAKPRVGISTISAVGNVAGAAAGMPGSVWSKGMALLGRNATGGRLVESSPCQVALGPDAVKSGTGGETVEPGPGGNGGDPEGVTDGTFEGLKRLFGN